MASGKSLVVDISVCVTGGRRQPRTGSDTGMRRRAPPARKRLSISGFEPLRDLSQTQLTLIGAISVVWTRIERTIDWAMCVSLNVPDGLTFEVASRINGFDGKLALIKRGAERYLRVPQESIDLLSDSLGEIDRYRKYRDGVVHAWVTEPNAKTADIVQRRGIIDEVIISEGALESLYERLLWLEDESGDILLILNYYLEMNVHGRPDIAQLVQIGIPEIREHQKRRKSAPPLPAFPEDAG
jgi:hypothetical protein